VHDLILVDVKPSGTGRAAESRETRDQALGGGVSGGNRTEWSSATGNAAGRAVPGVGAPAVATATVNWAAAQPVISRQCDGGWVGALFGASGVQCVSWPEEASA